MPRFLPPIKGEMRHSARRGNLDARKATKCVERASIEPGPGCWPYCEPLLSDGSSARGWLHTTGYYLTRVDLFTVTRRAKRYFALHRYKLCEIRRARDCIGTYRLVRKARKGLTSFLGYLRSEEARFRGGDKRTRPRACKSSPAASEHEKSHRCAKNIRDAWKNATQKGYRQKRPERL